MKQNRYLRFLPRSTKGASIVNYSLVVGLVSVMTVTSALIIGNRVNDTYTDNQESVAGETPAPIETPVAAPSETVEGPPFNFAVTSEEDGMGDIGFKKAWNQGVITGDFSEPHPKMEVTALYFAPFTNRTFIEMDGATSNDMKKARVDCGEDGILEPGAMKLTVQFTGQPALAGWVGNPLDITAGETIECTMTWADPQTPPAP